MALTLQTAVGMGLPSSLKAPSTSHSAPTQGTWIADGEYVLAPMKSIRFCMNNPDDCRMKGELGLVFLEEKTWSDLNVVNQQINSRIAPAYASAGQLDWSVTTSYGDCNDFAVQKRHELLARGWPSSALSLAVVIIPTGEGHLVLTVRTDRGDVVLDNLRPGIVMWNRTGYRFVKRQSNESPKFWVEAKGGRALPALQVVAIRSTEKIVPASDDLHEVRADISAQASIERGDGAIALVSVDGAPNINMDRLQPYNAESDDQSPGL
jgi:predicted transglutaminase-like cysteine proteinase